VQILLTSRLPVPLAVAVSLLPPLLVYQPGMGLCVPARGRGAVATAAPGLLAKHGPLRAAHGRGPIAVAALGLSTGHGPLCAAHGRGLAALLGCGGHVV